MKNIPHRIVLVVSWIALAVLLAAPFLFAAGVVTLEMQKGLLLAGTVAWFASAPFWMKSS